ncbi:glutathionylspermidine synthase family protein [Nocardia sp. NBC_01499]|uniref:hypothetical protein n=1 Tax=Nocardia sp. NBC_01499 TaxID=2903597 RepID=UPI003867BD5B
MTINETDPAAGLVVSADQLEMAPHGRDGAGDAVLSEALERAGMMFYGSVHPCRFEPLVVPASTAHAVRTATEGLHAVLEKAVRYRLEGGPGFPAGLAGERLGLPMFEPINQVCRFDGLLDVNGEYKIVEINACRPGGVLYTAQLMRIWREVADPPEAVEMAQPLLEQPDLYIDQLLDAYAQQHRGTPDEVFVVSLDGQYQVEVPAMLKMLRGKGIAADQVNATELRIRSGTIRDSRGRTADLLCNNMDPAALLALPAAAEYLFAETRTSGCFVNPLASLYLHSDKAMLAALSDPRSAHLWTDTEQALIDRHLPWTRLLSDDTTTDPDHNPISSPQYVADHQHQLVIKPADRSGGTGVLIGPVTAPARWRAAIAAACSGQRYVVQQYIHPPALPGAPEWYYDLDVFVFGGRFAGFWSRASTDPVINLRRGAMNVPVVALA